MNNPYEILGVSPSASDDDIKTAYRNLARKYHPDNYQNNPLADLASEKMKEINQAYDQIMQARRAGNTAGTSGAAYNRVSQFADIRRLIASRRVTEAEELLDGVPKQNRDAEWHFLKGHIQYTRGWLNEAVESFSRAVQMDPANSEYSAALNRLRWQQTTGHSGIYGTNNASANCDICDICTALYCMDCLCSCLR